MRSRVPEDNKEYETIRHDPEGGGWYCLEHEHEVVTIRGGTNRMTAATRAADDASFDGDKDGAESIEWKFSRHHRRLLEATTTEHEDHQEPPNGPIYDECSNGYTYNFESTLYAPSG